MILHFVWFALLTAGSLVLAKSPIMRRSLTCEQQLQAVDVDVAVCDRIRSAVTSVRHAVKDIDEKMRESTKDAIEEATDILRSNTKLFKEQLPKYLPHHLRRKRQVVSQRKREAQGDSSDFEELAARAAASAVSAVKNASKEIRGAIFQTIIEIHSSSDKISEATRDILGRVMAKRSADEPVDLGEAMLKVGTQMKASMTKAVRTALNGFKDLLDNFENKLHALLMGKVQIGFFSQSKTQIAQLADQASQNLVDYYDTLAMKTVDDAILHVHKLVIAVYMVEKSTQNANALSTLRAIVELESEAVKDEVHSEAGNQEKDVVTAMQNAADQMKLDYNDIVRIVNSA